MTSHSGRPADQVGARAAALRRYLAIRVACIAAAVLLLAAILLAFLFKQTIVGFIASLTGFVVFFVAFQILMRKRRVYFRKWIGAKNEPGTSPLERQG